MKADRDEEKDSEIDGGMEKKWRRDGEQNYN